MIDLASLMWIMVILFGLIGALRGWAQELISFASVVLSLFIIEYLGTRITETLANDNTQIFYVYAFIIIIVTFFGYQTPKAASLISQGKIGGRLGQFKTGFQNILLGFFLGCLNGYMIFGSLWWYLHALDYPVLAISPQDPALANVIDVQAHLAMINALPMNWLVGEAGGDATVLTILMILIFLFVIVVMI